MRASSGASSIFGFTGEQLDGETGFTFLRARYLNPALGRFVSADSVQPNAPGTQGYNPYAYVANNPTTWVDPSGHDVNARGAAITAYVISTPLFMSALMQACAQMSSTPALQPVGGQPVPNPGQGLAFGVCQAIVFTAITVPVLVCALTPGCFQDAWDWAGKIGEFGSNTFEGVRGWTIGQLQNAVDSWPKLPDLTNVFSDSEPLSVSPERREHILHGDGSTGGHLYGTGTPGQTEFPEDWTEDDIIGAIETIPPWFIKSAYPVADSNCK